MSFEKLVASAETAVSDASLNSRYNGESTLTTLGVSIPANVRALEVVVNWPRLVVDSMTEVLTLDGFESSEMPQEAIDVVWKTWQRENMKALSHLAHAESLTQGVSYALVGVRSDGSIRTTVMPRDGVSVGRNYDGDIAEAVVVREVENEYGSKVKQAVHYTPTAIEVHQQVNGLWALVKRQRGCGLVPVIPLVNKTRLGDTVGRSEMELVIPYGDAASRSFTLLQLATEILSMPQRWMVGGDLSNFKRADGTTPTKADIYLGSFLTVPKEDVKFGQFPGADLSQVISVLKHCAEMVSAMTGIPVSMLGVTTSNPSSAEAMRAAKERMISRGEFKQDLFGDAWEQWARVVLAMSGIQADTSTLSSVWRDIAVPSNSAKAAHLLQAHAQGVITARTARDGLPLSSEQRARENQGADVAQALGLPAGEELVDAE